ncbi:MAG TPA: M23 family metallopeptidase [Pseudolysinimonas sp.]|nr:M23 family metallopeptidase [Pseudolysinimonas sp.]
MSRTRALAASLALALVPVSVLTGVIVPPSYAASRDTTPPEITWAQVAAAQASVAATKALADKIKAQVAGLQASVDKAQAEATAKGDAYAKAQDAFDGQEYIVEKRQAQADAAKKEADAAKKTAGQLLAQLAKSGGADGITTSLLGNSGQADQLLAKVGYMSQITDRSKQVYEKALRLQKGAQALTDQADAAKVILAKYKDAAETAFAEAQAASDAAATALKAAQATFADLSAKLTKLTNAADQTLSAYNASLVAKWGPGAAGVVSASGWANPANGYLGDRFGQRWWPFPPHGWRLHTGQDISGTGCGTPIYAAHSGTVTYAGPYSDLGNFIQLDNGGGITTGYGHIVNGGILVGVGQHVAPGQQIGKVGSTGASLGCHLHFIVRINGALTDPLPFMRDRGITLGS